MLFFHAIVNGHQKRISARDSETQYGHALSGLVPKCSEESVLVSTQADRDSNDCSALMCSTTQAADRGRNDQSVLICSETLFSTPKCPDGPVFTNTQAGGRGDGPSVRVRSSMRTTDKGGNDHTLLMCSETLWEESADSLFMAGQQPQLSFIKQEAVTEEVAEQKTAALADESFQRANPYSASLIKQEAVASHSATMCSFDAPNFLSDPDGSTTTPLMKPKTPGPTPPTVRIAQAPLVAIGSKVDRDDIQKRLDFDKANRAAEQQVGADTPGHLIGIKRPLTEVQASTKQVPVAQRQKPNPARCACLSP